jgi:hypothetical protein
MPEVPNLAQQAAQARAQQQEQARAPKVVEAVTAFVVYVLPDGRVGSTADLDQAITKQRDPGAEEVAYACLQVHDELQLQRTAAMTSVETINRSMQLNAQMRAQAEAQQTQQVMEQEKQMAAPSRR